MALALAPLHAQFGIEAVIATTLQAVSGAGYPGVPSLDVVDNVIPFIGGEEPKMESETRKILGTLGRNNFENAPFAVSAQCHRVNVADGHLVAVRVKLAKRVSIEQVRESLVSYRSVPQELNLHTAPKHPVLVRSEDDRPQPRLDRDAGGGMSVTVGRLFPDSVFDYRFVVLGHNTVRGAAGAAILNAELLQARGLLRAKSTAETAVPEKRGCDEPSDPGDEIRRDVDGDAGRIRSAAKIAADTSRDRAVVVVVSAMSGVTNTLIAAAGKAAAGDEAAAEALTKALQAKHHEAIGELITNIETAPRTARRNRCADRARGESLPGARAARRTIAARAGGGRRNRRAANRAHHRSRSSRTRLSRRGIRCDRSDRHR